MERLGWPAWAVRAIWAQSPPKLVTIVLDLLLSLLCVVVTVFVFFGSGVGSVFWLSLQVQALHLSAAEELSENEVELSGDRAVVKVAVGDDGEAQSQK